MLLWEGGGYQKNSLNPPQDIYKAYLITTIKLEKQFPKSLASDKKNLLLFIIEHKIE